MTRKIILTSIVWVGFVMAFGSNAWADHDRGKRGHRSDKGYHHKFKNPPGHHYGWQKGKGNPHRDRYQHRRVYRYRDGDGHYRNHQDRYYKRHHNHKRVVEKHVYRDPKRHRHVEKHVYHHPKRYRHVEKHVYHHPKRHRHVEKHVYHHYPKRHRYGDDNYNIAFALIDQVLGITVAVGATH
ncbi:MAG: hypothetical protein PVJ53_01505 [Desulfobacterales bacterium]